MQQKLSELSLCDLTRKKALKDQGLGEVAKDRT